MAEHGTNMPNQSSYGNQAAGYMKKAAEACAGGDLLLGMHLYLAASEQAARGDSASTNVEVAALREAWNLACDLKERSMAEFVFEKLEPFLTGEEIASCAMKLQELALDRLEQYGISREDLEDMAESITQDFLGENAHVVKVESVSIPHMGMFGVPDATIEATVIDQAPPAEEEVEEGREPELDAAIPAQLKVPSKPPHVGMGVADVNSFNPYDEFKTSSVGTSYHAATVEGSGAYVFTRDEERAGELTRVQQEQARKDADLASGRQSEDAPAAAQVGEAPVMRQSEDAPAAAQAGDAPAATRPPESSAASDRPASDLAKTVPAAPAAPSEDPAPVPAVESAALNYRTLAGYDDAIAVMRDIGVALARDPGFLDFVRMMNARHGLDRMPAVDTLLFRSDAIEDATRFVEATVGELGLPMLRMSMEEGVGGGPVLCVSAQGNNRPRMNHAHNRFEGPGILVIDELDMWVLPEMPDVPEGFGSFVMANISRGAREAVNLIRSAVEDPDVFVFATASNVAETDPFFYGLLEPITIIDIGLPNEKERTSIWAEIAHDHPSIRGIDRNDLVRFSDGMARFDIYMAARDAIEDAYKAGLVQRKYMPVTPQNLFDKLAACYPLDSDRYRELEQAVVDDFRGDLDHLEDLLD